MYGGKRIKRIYQCDDMDSFDSVVVVFQCFCVREMWILHATSITSFRAKCTRECRMRIWFDAANIFSLCNFLLFFFCFALPFSLSVGRSVGRYVYSRSFAVFRPSSFINIKQFHNDLSGDANLRALVCRFISVCCALWAMHARERANARTNDW